MTATPHLQIDRARLEAILTCNLTMLGSEHGVDVARLVKQIAAALPSLVWVQRPEDVAQAKDTISRLRYVSLPDQSGATGHFAALATTAADVIEALLPQHTGQPQEGASAALCNLIEAYENDVNPNDRSESAIRHARAEIARLNEWADGFSDAQLKERRLCEERIQEMQRTIDKLSLTLMMIREGCADPAKFAGERLAALSASPPPPVAESGWQREVLDWAVDKFGPITLDPRERAMRFVEEAVELAQTQGVTDIDLGRICRRVFTRPAGDAAKEIGQVGMTFGAMAENIGLKIAPLIKAEIERVKTIPKEEWQRRHAAKVAVGTTLPAPPHIAKQK